MSKSGVLCALIAFALVVVPAGCAPKRPATSTPTTQPIVAPPSATTAPSPSATPPAGPAAEPTATLKRPGLTVVIDPGHGGEDLGARHFDHNDEMDLHESTVTLAVALKLGARLEALGYHVAYTRDGDYEPYLDTDMDGRDVNGDGEITQRDIVQTRTDLANESGADLLLSIHMNAWETDDVELRRATGGIETYYCPDRPFGETNLRLANLVHENIIAAVKRFGYDLDDRGVRIDDAPYYPGDPGGHLMILGPVDDVIVRSSNMPGVLSEMMFITCDAEAALMQREDVQDALAQAYADAIVTLFEEEGLNP